MVDGGSWRKSGDRPATTHDPRPTNHHLGFGIWVLDFGIWDLTPITLMDLYVVLGLQHGATEGDIRRAYRRLARRYHPDINPGDGAAEARFRQIVLAYETLIDPDRRSRYDAGHATEDDGTLRKSGFGGFGFSVVGIDHSATFGDLFAEVLSERGPARPERERGID